MSRITRLVENVESHEIFVFGSNEAGRHGKGAAKTALRFGAKNGVGIGLHGNTYAIPTKDDKIKTLSISKITRYVNTFIAFAKEHRELNFMVTEIGCGLAGYEAKDIGPLFKDAIDVDNISLPVSFWNVLK